MRALLIKCANVINNELNIGFLASVYYLIQYIKVDFSSFLKICYFLKACIGNSSPVI